MLTAARMLSARHLASRRSLILCAIFMLVLAMLLAIAWRQFLPTPRTPDPAAPADPLSMDVRQVMPVSRQTAAAINARIPVAGGPASPASPFSAAFAAMDQQARALHCLTQAIYYESANEPDGGQRAVAQVILNRVRHPTFPNSVCGVVYQGSNRRTGCQFTFTCDGSLARRPSASGWARAQAVAQAALAGSVYGAVGNSTHYHADYVVPYWASSLVKTAVVGAHIFYRWRGSAGLASAFTDRHSGVEPLVSGRMTAIAAPTADAANIATSGSLVDPANPALLVPARPVSEENAEELDDFGLLAYRKPSSPPPTMGAQDGRLAAAVSAAAAQERNAVTTPGAERPAS